MTQRAGEAALQQREGRPSARPPGATPVGVHSFREKEASGCFEAARRKEGGKAMGESDVERGDFGDFPEVGLLGPAAVLGERSPPEVAHKPSAINHSARVG